ncbi:hypothetical protein [Lignipirellula cremea]|uniref:hypothetical protein n=1 Tax=Lignipirellula cremea TaxID=2528010 RepID=UPI0011A29F7B|nr:hypothetical protein [Lignipirellula cremea]
MTPVPSNRAREIEAWFRDHENGEFVVAPSVQPSKLVGDRSTSRTVIYTTKLPCLLANLSAFDVEHRVLIVARAGLPIPTDLIHLNDLPVGANCWFVGDADPPCILTFAWLREHVAIGWLGVNDELLNRNPTSDCGRLRIPMSDAEKLTMPVLANLCPDFRDLLGPHCCQMLDGGFKIELEGAMMHLRSGPVA